MKRYLNWHNTVSGISGAPAGTSLYWPNASADACAELSAFNALTDAQKISQSVTTVPAASSGMVWQVNTCENGTGNAPTGSNGEVVVSGSNDDYTTPSGGSSSGGSTPATTGTGSTSGSGTNLIQNGNPDRMNLRVVDAGTTPGGKRVYKVIDDAPANDNYRYSVNGQGIVGGQDLYTRAQLQAMIFLYGLPVQVHMFLTNGNTPSYDLRTSGTATTNAQSLLNVYAPSTSA